MANSIDVKKFVSVGRKILGVGRNYREHAAELGNALPEKPLLFMKPTSAYITEGSLIKFPEGCKEMHHEVELGVIIGRPGSHIQPEQAMDYVAGYTVALDMTARDFQSEAKAKRLPWTLAKAFDTSCPVGDFLSKELIPDPHALGLWLKVNNVLRQTGNTKDMIFRVPALLTYISTYFTLEPGDLILTGTPAGVGPVVSGDVIEAGIDGVSKISFKVQ